MAGPIGRILVGVDGSSNAQRGLQWAISLATAFGAEVLAVHAVGLLEHLEDGDATTARHAHLGRVREVFETKWCAPLRDGEVPYRALMLDGPPALVLVRAAEREKADLVVVGSRGTGGFAELLLGSTSLQLAQHSSVPVLIVPTAVTA